MASNFSSNKNTNNAQSPPPATNIAGQPAVRIPATTGPNNGQHQVPSTSPSPAAGLASSPQGFSSGAGATPSPSPTSPGMSSPPASGTPMAPVRHVSQLQPVHIKALNKEYKNQVQLGMNSPQDSKKQKEHFQRARRIQILLQQYNEAKSSPTGSPQQSAQLMQPSASSSPPPTSLSPSASSTLPIDLNFRPTPEPVSRSSSASPVLQNSNGPSPPPPPQQQPQKSPLSNFPSTTTTNTTASNVSQHTAASAKTRPAPQTQFRPPPNTNINAKNINASSAAATAKPLASSNMTPSTSASTPTAATASSSNGASNPNSTASLRNLSPEELVAKLTHFRNLQNEYETNLSEVENVLRNSNTMADSERRSYKQKEQNYRGLRDQFKSMVLTITQEIQRSVPASSYSQKQNSSQSNAGASSTSAGSSVTPATSNPAAQGAGTDFLYNQNQPKPQLPQNTSKAVPSQFQKGPLPTQKQKPQQNHAQGNSSNLKFNPNTTTGVNNLSVPATSTASVNRTNPPLPTLPTSTDTTKHQYQKRTSVSAATSRAGSPSIKTATTKNTTLPTNDFSGTAAQMKRAESTPYLPGYSSTSSSGLSGNSNDFHGIPSVGTDGKLTTSIPASTPGSSLSNPLSTPVSGTSTPKYKPNIPNTTKTVSTAVPKVRVSTGKVGRPPLSATGGISKNNKPANTYTSSVGSGIGSGGSLGSLHNTHTSSNLHNISHIGNSMGGMSNMSSMSNSGVGSAAGSSNNLGSNNLLIGPSNIFASASTPSFPPMQMADKVFNKRKIHELIKDLTPEDLDGIHDNDVDDLIGDLVEEFVDNVTKFACRLAKHRKSEHVETRDVQLHLERNWNIRVPGYLPDEVPVIKRPAPTKSYMSRIDSIAVTKLYGFNPAAQNPSGGSLPSSGAGPSGQ